MTGEGANEKIQRCGNHTWEELWMEWTDMEYQQITVVKTAGRMMKRHKSKKADLYNTMEPRSYGYMIHIHYTFPKHTEKKFRCNYPHTYKPTVKYPFICKHFFEFLLCTKFWRLRINLWHNFCPIYSKNLIGKTTQFLCKVQSMFCVAK